MKYRPSSYHNIQSKHMLPAHLVVNFLKTNWFLTHCKSFECQHTNQPVHSSSVSLIICNFWVKLTSTQNANLGISLYGIKTGQVLHKFPWILALSVYLRKSFLYTTICITQYPWFWLGEESVISLDILICFENPVFWLHCSLEIGRTTPLDSRDFWLSDQLDTTWSAISCGFVKLSETWQSAKMVIPKKICLKFVLKCLSKVYWTHSKFSCALEPAAIFQCHQQSIWENMILLTLRSLPLSFVIWWISWTKQDDMQNLYIQA